MKRNKKSVGWDSLDSWFSNQTPMVNSQEEDSVTEGDWMIRLKEEEYVDYDLSDWRDEAVENWLYLDWDA